MRSTLKHLIRLTENGKIRWALVHNEGQYSFQTRIDRFELSVYKVVLKKKRGRGIFSSCSEEHGCALEIKDETGEQVKQDRPVYIMEKLDGISTYELYDAISRYNAAEEKRKTEYKNVFDLHRIVEGM
jgi:hypothetical protein